MKTGERLFVATLGALLLGVGLYVVMLRGPSPAWQYLGGGVLCLLGVNAVYGSLTGKRPWIARVGPLP